MPVLVLAGDEEFELSRKIIELREKLLDPAWASMNYLRLENPPISTIVEHAAALPFGPGNKVILIDKCELFTKKRGGKSSDAEETTAKGKASELDRFEEALGSVASNTYLVFSCPFNFDKTLKTSKAISKHANISEFPRERFFPGSKNPKLETWCQREAKHHGVTIDDDAIQYLLDGLEGDLRQISSELQKASIRIMPNKHIKLATVLEMSPHHSHVFALAENWVNGRGNQALGNLKELLSRQSAMPIIAAMQTMLTKWIQMKALCDKMNGELPSGPGLNRRELPIGDLAKRVAAELKMHPYACEQDLKRIAKIPTSRLIDKRVELTRMENLLKTGQMPEQHALELFIVG